MKPHRHSNRIAACLFAHNDKLSEPCEGMLEIGLNQLSIILSTVNYVVEQCYRDIDKHCEGVVIGGGRLHRWSFKKQGQAGTKVPDRFHSG